MENEKHLKPKQHYIDLYDRHTVDYCKNIIEIFSQPLKNPPLIGGKKPTKVMVDTMSKMALDYRMMFAKGDRYTQKEETIREWMDRDQARDELYESATPPEGIHCLTCQRAMTMLDKDLWTGGLKEPDRILFMFDCPNGHLPRRAFFNDGEEWKHKREVCPKCGGEFNVKATVTKKKFIDYYSCKSCDFKKTEELERTANKEEIIDPDFAADRTKFCLSEEEGRKWRETLASWEQMGKLVDSWKEKEKNKEVYDKIAKIKKLTIVELEKLLIPPLEKEHYIYLKFGNPEITRDIIVPFTVQDSKGGREKLASDYELRQLLKKVLKETNWRLMSDGVSYRLGILSGRLRGYENEEDMLKLVKEK